jgi:hypothetical protein
MIIRIVTLILLLTGCFSLSHAKTNGFRIGIQFGGTQFLGINIEKFYGDNSVRLNLGFFEVQEICISCSFNHYFLSSDVRPFVGIGLWDVLAITWWNWLIDTVKCSNRCGLECEESSFSWSRTGY